MELTIEQALQQGIAAQKEGNLQEAERLYRAILQSQPHHSDANHNLGLIAVSVDNVAAALPLFKTAIEANPKKEEFWLSYIDALIKGENFDNAKKVLEHLKKRGLTGEKVDALEERLTPITKAAGSAQIQRKKAPSESKRKKNKKQRSKGASPSDAEINNLRQYYQNGQYHDAEELALSLTERFPSHQFAWKILSVVFQGLGRMSESLEASQKSIELMPKDAGAHYNLGITLKELGRLDEAEASYRQAAVLKPDFAEAHNNLGNSLHEKGRLEEAEASFRKAIALKPDFALAHNNLGNSHNELGRFDEAEASFKKAIALNPDDALAHYNLGMVFKEMDRLEEAEACYTQVIELRPDYIEAHRNLLESLFLLGKRSLFFEELEYLINLNDVGAVIGSFTCRSALKYGVERENLFCRDPLKHVLQIDLNAQYDFREIFVKTAKAILNKKIMSNRKQPLLINGYQTSGNLFDVENYFTEEIQNIIRLEIERYRNNFKNSDEGLIKRWPSEYSLHAWLISIKRGGQLKPHIHTQGWLSGSVYINVPRKSKADSGNLVVSIGEEKDATDTRINEKKIIDVVTGNLVLFPASLTHYTIPFESEEERIVLAFDVNPITNPSNSAPVPKKKIRS